MRLIGWEGNIWIYRQLSQVRQPITSLPLLLVLPLPGSWLTAFFYLAFHFFSGSGADSTPGYSYHRFSFQGDASWMKGSKKRYTHIYIYVFLFSQAPEYFLLWAPTLNSLIIFETFLSSYHCLCYHSHLTQTHTLPALLSLRAESYRKGKSIIELHLPPNFASTSVCEH